MEKSNSVAGMVICKWQSLVVVDRVIELGGAEKYGIFKDPIIIPLAAERFWFYYLSPLADFGLAKFDKAQNRLRSCLLACGDNGGGGGANWF